MALSNNPTQLDVVKAIKDLEKNKLDTTTGVTLSTEQTITAQKTHDANIILKNNKWLVNEQGRNLICKGTTSGNKTVVGNIFDNTVIASSSRPAVASGTDKEEMAFVSDITTALATAKAQWLLDMNPVGTIIENNTGTNPSTYIGGTWQLYGQGKVTVCFDSSDNDFGGTVGTTGSYEASTQIADYGSATINLAAGKGKIDHIVYNGTTINNGASGTFINNFYFFVYDDNVVIDSDYDSSQTCTITIYHIPAEGKMSGGSKALQSHTHSAIFTGKQITGTHSPIPEGKSTAYASGCFSVPKSATKFGGIYQNATGNGRPVTFTATPEGTIDIRNAGNGYGGNLQPYIVVYRWIRTA